MPELYGRTMITIDAEVITDKNIIEILRKTKDVHETNRAAIQYLWDYYKGKQPILQRKKEVRPEICNKIVENRANEIVSFKVGYLCGEPIQYIAKTGDENVSAGVSRLNSVMESVDKDALDRDLVEWQMVCGTANRLVLPKNIVDEDDAPFDIYTLDPRGSYVAYSVDVDHTPMLGVKYYVDEENKTHYSAYSRDRKWEIVEDKIISSEEHPFGLVPIFEYPANNARLGAFEIVLPLLDEMNSVASNRLDGIEQFIQAFLKFINCEITADKLDEFKKLGAIMVKSPPGVTADVGIVSSQLDQAQTQITKDDTYNAILTICGMPNRNGGTSTSDTGQAVILRDGWSLAESRAKDSENSFKRSERKMLRFILKICRDVAGAPEEIAALKLSDITLKFTRRNYEAIQSKSQVLVSMLGQSKIHPRLAFESSGLFIDPESAYAQSMKYYEEQAAKAMEQTPTTGDNSTVSSGSAA